MIRGRRNQGVVMEGFGTVRGLMRNRENRDLRAPSSGSRGVLPDQGGPGWDLGAGIRDREGGSEIRWVGGSGMFRGREGTGTDGGRGVLRDSGEPKREG